MIKTVAKMNGKTNAPVREKTPRRGLVKAIVQRYGSDSYKYCETGRFTIVEGELTHGSEGVDRIIFRYCPMKWSDSEKQLSAVEREKVFQAVVEYLDNRKIRWKFSDSGIED